MRFFEVKTEDKAYRFTAHGQTPDLYEELYGEDADILSDLRVYLDGQAKMFAGLDKSVLPKLQKLAEIKSEDITAEKAQEIMNASASLKLNVVGNKSMRKIITCLLMQTERDKGNEPTLPELLQSVPASIFYDPYVITECVKLITGDSNKKKQITPRTGIR